jgi:cytochrome c biogenesis protein CcmG/thiol:disulfide interchange protein DsbE
VEAPHLEALYRKYRDQGLVILGLSLDQDHQAARGYARKTFTYPALLDAGPVAQNYGVLGIPRTFILDRDGKIVSRHVGFNTGMEKTLEEEAKKLLGSEPASR